MTEIKNVLKIEDPTGFTYYLGTLPPKSIKELTFVPVVTKSTHAGQTTALHERDEQGYQRAGDPKRMDKIKGFVRDNPDCIIPPVVLSARGKWKFTPSSSNKLVGTLVADDLAAIIDGQHRLGGLWLLANDQGAEEGIKARPLPFMLIEDISIEREQGNFVDINENQQGVKKSLLKYLGREETFIGQAAVALSEDEDSVFCGRISVQKKEDWSLILFGAATECVALTFDAAFVSGTKFKPDYSAETKSKALSFILEYWRCVSTSMQIFWSDMDKMPQVNYAKSPDTPGTRAFEYRLLEETGIRAISKLGSEILRKAWVPASNAPAWDRVAEILAQLAEVDEVRKALTKPSKDPEILSFDPNLKSSGKAGVQAIYTHLQTALLQL